MKTIAIALVSVAAVLAPAVEAAGPSGSVTLASQYISRGFQQSWGRPVLQAGAQYDWDNGLFVGTWASGVDDRFYEGGSVEWDVYAGYSRRVKDITWSATVYYYDYPGARMSAADARYDYGEVILAARWRMLSLSYAHTWTRDYCGYNSATLGIGQGLHSRHSGYWDLSADIPLGEATRLKLHAGYQNVRNFDRYDWSDARIGLEHALKDRWTLGVFYARGWNDDGVYDAYTTGVPDDDGEVHVSSPLNGAWAVTLTRTF